MQQYDNCVLCSRRQGLPPVNIDVLLPVSTGSFDFQFYEFLIPRRLPLCLLSIGIRTRDPCCISRMDIGLHLNATFTDSPICSRA